MSYKSVVVTRRGGPEVMHVVENELRPPAAGEVRVRVLASCVCAPDVQARYGQSPFSLKPPFTPGYAVIGVVDALGAGVTQIAPGAQVGGHCVTRGYAEYIYLAERELIPVPAGLDPAEAVMLILNYLVAYQTLHRTARVKAGQTALIIGASGGIGTAYLQLGRLAGLKMYGLASPGKHAILSEYGVTPIDYHSQDFVSVIRQAEPGGLDVVFDGMGGDYVPRGLALLKRGGMLVEYGNPLSNAGLLRLLGRMAACNLLPTGKALRVYGTGLMRFNRRPFLEDWATLFALLGEGKIKPVIAARLPLLEAAQGNALLESGQVVGNIALLAPELMGDE